jgi:hypothetical protein
MLMKQIRVPLIADQVLARMALRSVPAGHLQTRIVGQATAGHML